MMKYIGTHVPAMPTVASAPGEARALGAGAFALNLVDPSRFRTPAYGAGVADEFKANCAACGYTAAQILPHAGFVINLASPEPQKLKLSQMALEDEMCRADSLGLTMVNFHPGAHLKKSSEAEALAQIAKALDKVLANTPGTVTAVIENTAGQGSNLGYSLQHLADIIGRVSRPDRVGVCIDTAHAFAAGYNLATAEGYETFWAEFDTIVGRHYLRGMHLNDSQRALGSRIDRHACIGTGAIGIDAFKRLVADPRTDNIPLILETPDPSLWADEIKQLYSFANTHR